MQDKYTNNGERLVLKNSSKRVREDHLSRYEFTTSIVSDKVVLDVACGTGYGCEMISDYGAKKIIGIDLSEDSIEYANKHHQTPNTEYLCRSAADIGLPASSVDVVVTFETIEHLDSEVRAKYLDNLHNVLQPDGVLMLSTPNKNITSPWSSAPLNPHHVLEYTKQSLEAELATHGFTVQTWYGQRFVFKMYNYRLIYLAVRVIEKLFGVNLGIYDIANGAQVLPWKSALYEPRYFVLIAKKH